MPAIENLHISSPSSGSSSDSEDNGLVMQKKLNGSAGADSDVLNQSSSMDAIKGAHVLNCDTNDLTQYYDNWAAEYDQDCANEEYMGPKYISSLYTLLPPMNRNLNEKILDVGCGTGLIGRELSRRGYKNIDGIDLVQKMVDIAATTGCYRQLTGNADLNKRLEFIPDNTYDGAISCGVFTLGHVPPRCLKEVMRVIKPGGLILISTRRSYCEEERFDEYLAKLASEGKLSIVTTVRDGPYTADETAHYWGLRVL